VVTVALPSIGRDLDADLATLQWTVNAYTLFLAALILVGGGLGDRFGRRRVFLVGTVGFTVGSVACALAPTAELLVAARAVQGVGGALLTPMSLALLQTVIRPQDRARAIGAWSGATSLATVAGPLVGGALAAASWRWVFWINVPVAAVTVWLALRAVPETRSGSTDRLDLLGAGLGALCLGTGTWALISVEQRGASATVLAAAAVSVAAGAAFVVREGTARAPMVPPSLFRDRTFTAANLYTLLAYAALGGMGLLLTLQLQVSLGYTPLQAGAALLPLSLLLALLSARAGALA